MPAMTSARWSAAMPRANGALAGLYGLLAMVSVAAYPEPSKWVCFAAIVSLALVDMGWRLHRGRELSFDLADALLVSLIAYAALSLAWSANANGGIQTVIIASCCLALAVYLKSFATVEVFTGIAIGIGMADLFALATNMWFGPEQWSGFGNRGYAAEAFTLSIPFMWPLWRFRSPVRSRQQIARAFAAIVAAADAGYVLLFTPSMIEAFVAAVFLAIASLVLAFRRGRRLGWAVVAAWVLLPPLIAWGGWDALKLTSRLLIRTELWVNTGFMVADRPLFGHGAGSFIEVYPLYKEAHGDLMPFVNTAFESYVTEAEAAHNDPIQLLTELGIFGLLPFLAIVAWALRAGARRMASDPFAAAGGAALITILTESLIEYPFQRAATLFLAAVALGFVGQGQPQGFGQWRVRLPGPIRHGAIPISVVAMACLLFASHRQYEAEILLDRARAPGTDPVRGFEAMYQAYKLDPLERRVRTALPVMLDGLIRARGAASVPKSLIDEVNRAVDDGGHFNTSSLVARAQIQLETTRGDDPEFPQLLTDLKRGSARVAAAYAIEARWHIIHERYLAALAAIAEGRKYTEGVSAIPGADEAIKTNLNELERTALAALELQRQLQQQQLDRQAQPKKLESGSVAQPNQE
jgi:O-antigen ligase